MYNYEKINTVKPEGIEQKHAYLLGGGIGSLAAAAFLIRDGHMPGENIHIYESLERLGGSMDGQGSWQEGYTARGGREIEPHFECFDELFSFIPSLKDPDRTVLDEFHELNVKEPILSNCRLVEKQGQPVDCSDFGLSTEQAMKIFKLVMTTEEALGNTTIVEFFGEEFLETNFWYFFETMFAFEPWHSVVEVKRYMQRFMHMIEGIDRLDGLLHTEYNQYDSLILPLITWLEKHGVVFHTGCNITDITIDQKDGRKRATGFVFTHNGKKEEVAVAQGDLVMFTNGSMTQNTTRGSLNEPAVLNRSTERGCFSVWEKLAKQSPDFGHPEKFVSDVDKTKWLSFTVTLKDDDIVFPYLEKLQKNKSGMNGLVTIKDSNWIMSWVVPKDPHYIDQPANIKVLWAYALRLDEPGNYVKKTMSESTGKEMFEELLYHMGLESRIDEVLSHTINVIPAMMPYITSQFMPRVAGDRPQVIPAGSENFAFLGQYAEAADDCVFTVEYSVRTAMMAVYGLLNLEKKVEPVYPAWKDVDVLTKAAKACLGLKNVPVSKLPLEKILEGSELLNYMK